MAQSDWIFALEDRIFTVVKTKAKKELVGTFPDIKFTTSDKPTSQSSYPTVYIHEIPGYEFGADLKGEDINSIYYQMMVEVYGNTNKADVKNVMQVVAGILKEMKFQIVLSPNFTSTDPLYRQVMTVKRLIGQADKF